MRAAHRGVLFLLVLLTWTAPAAAQLCLGAPSFRDNPYQAGVSAAFTEGAHAVGGTFAGGGETLFAGAGVSVTTLRDLDDEKATSVGVLAGAEFAADTENRILLCPVAQFGFTSGPDIGIVELSAVSVQGGASLGIIVHDRDGVMVVPTFGLAAAYRRVSSDTAGLEVSASDSGGIANIGLGLIFNRNVGITPDLSIPFSFGDSDVVFTIRLTFNFGR